MASTSASLETSHLMVSRRGGLGRMAWTFWTAVAKAGSDMSAMRTAAPSRRKRMVVSSPIPLWIRSMVNTDPRKEVYDNVQNYVSLKV